MRYVRLVVFGVGAAVLPFLVVAFFTWATDGRPAGLVALLGRGELFPAATLLGAQSLGANYGVPMPLRGSRWAVTVGMTWLLMSFACGGYLVPYAAAAGYEARVAYSSVAALALVILASILAIRDHGREWRCPRC